MIDKIQHDFLRQRFNPDGSQLRNFQYFLVKMLKDVALICDQNQIDYCIAYGTCLGAVRHGGYIPWDDDIDIHIYYKDYIKFKEAIEKDSRYIFQDNETDDGYVFPFPKIRIKSEKLILNENGIWDIDYKYKTPYIDVFPLYCKEINKDINKICCRLYAIPQKFNRIRNNKIRLFLKKSIYRIIKNTLVPVILLFNKNKENDKISCTPAIDYSVFDRKDLFPTGTIIFEGESFKCPNNPEKYLKCIYGDFEKIPKLENIRIHLDSNCLNHFGN